MANIIQIKPKSQNVYAQAMKRRSLKTGIDYNKLYFGSNEEKLKEKKLQEKRRLMQSWESYDKLND